MQFLKNLKQASALTENRPTPKELADEEERVSQADWIIDPENPDIRRLRTSLVVMYHWLDTADAADVAETQRLFIKNYYAKLSAAACRGIRRQVIELLQLEAGHDKPMDEMFEHMAEYFAEGVVRLQMGEEGRSMLPSLQEWQAAGGDEDNIPDDPMFSKLPYVYLALEFEIRMTTDEDADADFDLYGWRVHGHRLSYSEKENRYAYVQAFNLFMSNAMLPFYAPEHPSLKKPD